MTPKLFSEDIYSSTEKGVEDYGVRQMTKIKPTTVLAARFDKFHHLCNLCNLCFALP